MMKVRLVKHLNFILLMLVTGVFWGTWFTMTRSIEEFSAAEFIHIGKVIIANVANPMRILMPASILFLALVTWIEYRRKSKTFFLVLTSLLLMIITLLITLLVEVPIDNQIKTWSALNVPDNWEAIRYKWANYHAFRTFTSIGSFILFSLATLIQDSIHNTHT